MTRLHDMRQVRLNDGHVVEVYNLNYYWFIGYSDITASHFETGIHRYEGPAAARV